ncbi:hypothetical protein B9Z19DRAFT_966080 [Tuber borchii]|uniref:Uncharacterized protein n=1 Tax=Tuber borchii TaxID=42251 RepID=A0A2T7A5E6_TUBBO|nr:hypothetical protein B9Z19DRAFT_966080 [Tuber borchii]
MVLEYRDSHNVHVVCAKAPHKAVAGLLLTEGITNENFYGMIEITFILKGPGSYTLRFQGGTVVGRDKNPLQPGKYILSRSDGEPLEPCKDAWLIKTIPPTGKKASRNDAFKKAVRKRDMGCVVTGEPAVNAQYGGWQGMQVAHIFPLALEKYWEDHGLGTTLISYPPPKSPRRINSVQNGMVLRSDVHELFDDYKMAINPDDNFKVVFFVRDIKNIAGRHLSQKLIDDPKRPVDGLLRWHYRQCVLANMRYD